MLMGLSSERKTDDGRLHGTMSLSPRVGTGSGSSLGPSEGQEKRPRVDVRVAAEGFPVKIFGKEARPLGRRVGFKENGEGKK